MWSSRCFALRLAAGNPVIGHAGTRAECLRTAAATTTNSDWSSG
jgi:hypothetical protein